MSAQIIATTDGIVTVKISGKLAQPDLLAVQQEAAKILHSGGRAGVLIIVEDFQGWEKEGDWGDLSFQLHNDSQIARMAMVGDRKWEDLALLFVAKGIRKFPIEFFPPSEMARARAWLTESP